MILQASTPAALAALARGAGRWLLGWWHLIHLAALLLAMALSPSTYRGESRRALARHVVLGTAPSLPWFTVLTALICLVLIRIVIVTALSYGLSQYALEMVVRMLVLELIPLTAALFAALRTTIPNAAEIAALRARDASGGRPGAHSRLLQHEVLPRVAAGVFSALMLAAVSCVMALVIAYLSIYGLTTAGFPSYTRTVGQVFNPAVSLIFSLKIVFFGIAVALVPVAAVLDAPGTAARTGAAARTFEGSARSPDSPREVVAGRREGVQVSAELQGLVRMFLVILLIEVASLVGNYY